MLTQKRLKTLLEYNQSTGIFNWLVGRGNVPPGKKAGYLKENGYIVIRVDSLLYQSHRLAYLYMTGIFPPDQIDHMNRNRSDNRWCNLRPSTASENHQNRSITSRNKSGVVGVHWNRSKKKWKASIYINGNNLTIGTFVDITDAIKARKSAELKYNFHRYDDLYLAAMGDA